MTYFFVYPFAVSGDRASIPTSDPTTGTMSYEDGFTENYQLVLGTDPDAIPIPRNQSNQLYFDITENINQYQTQGVPDWITAAQNLSAAYSYGIYAMVRYDAGSGIQIWESQEGSNTSTPGDDAKWRVTSGNAQGVPVGTVIDYAGISIPTSYLACDNALILRASYPALLAALTSVQTVTLTSASAEFTATSAFGLYVGMPIESPGFPDTTLIAALDGTAVTASAPADVDGATAVTFFQWGAGNGDTTFRAPDYRRKTSMGQGGTDTTVVGNQVGQNGGAETVTLSTNNIPPHNHPGSVGSSVSPSGVGYIQTLNGTVGTLRNYLISAGSASSTPYPIALTIASNPASSYTQTATSVVQPVNVVYKLIKYV